jgi:hypothetical protein
LQQGCARKDTARPIAAILSVNLPIAQLNPAEHTPTKRARRARAKGTHAIYRPFGVELSLADSFVV